MKKLALILAVALLAAPAFAAKVTVVPAGPLTADIMYDNGGQDVAAYAIDIALSTGEISEISNFHVGVSTSTTPGYGIFPANFDRYITVNGQGDVDNWGVAGYTPLADVNDKGVKVGGFTIELGALYKGDANKPANTGRLCTIKVTAGCTATPTVNEIRGGVVLSSASAASFTGVPGVILGDECITPEKPDYNEWVAMGKPDCWCFSTHCRGDADGLKEGTVKGGYKRVFINDLNVLIAGWNILEPPQGPGISTVPGGICADFDHAKEGTLKGGYKRVFINDLNILIANWNILEPPQGVGIPKDCSGTTPPQE